jgi:hypothetical protein
MYESEGRRVRFRDQLLQELNLDVSTEELLSAERAFTFADLCAMLGNRNTVLWLTQHAAVMCIDESSLLYPYYLQHDYRFTFYVDGEELVVMAHSPKHSLEICDVVLRLLAASVVHSVIIRNGALINTASLACLMEQCQSLKLLSLADLQITAVCLALIRGQT